MAVMAVFRVRGMTAEHYDEAMRRLETQGEAAPSGRLYHVSGPAGDEWVTVDVWESEEQLGRFGGVLAPIVAELGLTPPMPDVQPVHNIIQASTGRAGG